MTKIQSRRLNAMKYLAKVNPETYCLAVDKGRMTLFEQIVARMFDFYRPIATVDKDIRYLA